MKCIASTVCVLSVLIAVSYAVPIFPAQFSASSNLQLGSSAAATASSTSSPPTGGGGGGGLTNVLSNIDLPGLLRGVNSFVKIVGIFCPPLSQVLDNVIQNVTSTAFRIFGRVILRNGLGGGNNGGGAGGSSSVNVVLPTFPPDLDDDDYEDDETTSTAPGAEANVDLRSLSNSDDITTQSTVSPVASEDNTIAKRHVRVVRDTEAEQDEDQDGAESAPQPAEDLSNVDVDDTDRNKRYLPFGGGVEGHAAGGGSGNFLFDIIRNTADRAARTVGTVYRMVAGTENLGWGLTTTAETHQNLTPFVGASATPSAKLFAGSGATEESDEKANAPGGVAEVDIAKGADGYNTEGIPGPITRLFVIANRGIANLVQDLILRLAQTSERLVNFKARLVTSLI